MSIYFARGGRNKGRVGGSLHSSLISLLVSSPLHLSPSGAPSCCWHVITESSRPFLLSYFPAKKAEIVSPPCGTNSSLPSKASIAALYQDDLLHHNRQKNHNRAHSAQALWTLTHLITSVKLPSADRWGPLQESVSGVIMVL